MICNKSILRISAKSDVFKVSQFFLNFFSFFFTLLFPIIVKQFEISSSGFLCLFQGQGGQLLKKVTSAILFARWPLPIFKACVQSRLLSAIVFKLCTVIDITHDRKPIDFW